MPGGDGTGPMGMGPMTGRGAGYCAGYSVPGYMNPTPGGGAWGWGRGFGRGLGRGWGRGRWAAPAAYGAPAYGAPAYGAPAYGAAAYGAQPFGWPQPTPEQETETLKQQAEFLQSQLDAIQKRLDELTAGPAKV